MDILPQNSSAFNQKQCSKCGRVLPATSEYFPLSTTNKTGLRAMCKECRKGYTKRYNKEHKEEISEKHKQYLDNHKEEIADWTKKYRAENKEKIKDRKRQYNADHKEEIRAYSLKYRREHKEQFREYSKHRHVRFSLELSEEQRKKRREQYIKYSIGYYEEQRILRAQYKQLHREELSLKQRLYYEEHKEERLVYSKKYYQTDRGIAAKRSGTHNRRSLKKNAGGKHTAAQLQMLYQMQEGKCFYCGKEFGHARNSWHGDHYIPLSKGGSNDISNIVIACPSCNLHKNDKLPHEWMREVGNE